MVETYFFHFADITNSIAITEYWEPAPHSQQTGTTRACMQCDDYLELPLVLVPVPVPVQASVRERRPREGAASFEELHSHASLADHRKYTKNKPIMTIRFI